MEERLHARVVGQDEAVEAVANAVRRARAGSAGSEPADRLVHLPGPDRRRQDRAGARARRFLFDDETHIVRIDMSEYMEKHAVSRLIGAPPGYVGYDQGGQLTEAVRRRPYSVVLFDEIEKAHPDVFNVLLQLLDDGRLTDGQGRTVDFRNTVVIMTSNVGSQFLAGLDATWAREDKVMAELRRAFRPEFLNRVDDIVFFHPLAREDIDHIVDLQLDRLRKLLRERELGDRAVARGPHLPGRPRLRPAVRRPSAQAGDHALRAGSAGASACWRATSTRATRSWSARREASQGGEGARRSTRKPGSRVAAVS